MIFHPELLQISNVQRHPHHQQEPSFMETAQLIHTFIQWSYHMLHPLYFSLTILVEFQQKRANWCQLFVLLSSGPFVPSTSVSLDPSETCFIFCQGLRVKMIQNEGVQIGYWLAFYCDSMCVVLEYPRVSVSGWERLLIINWTTRFQLFALNFVVWQNHVNTKKENSNEEISEMHVRIT